MVKKYLRLQKKVEQSRRNSHSGPSRTDSTELAARVSSWAGMRETVFALCALSLAGKAFEDRLVVGGFEASIA